MTTLDPMTIPHLSHNVKPTKPFHLIAVGEEWRGTPSAGSLLTCMLRYFQQWIQDLNTGEYGGSPACSLPRKEGTLDP